MLVSSSILNSAVEKYKYYNVKRENYSNSDSAKAALSAAFYSFVLLIAVIFFIMELLVLFYAINISITCTKAGPERVVNIILAITFTLPYMLLQTLFNKCALQTLRNENVYTGSM
jgi:uncharacterized membrane protein